MALLKNFPPARSPRPSIFPAEVQRNASLLAEAELECAKLTRRGFNVSGDETRIEKARLSFASALDALTSGPEAGAALLAETRGQVEAVNRHLGRLKAARSRLDEVLAQAALDGAGDERGEQVGLSNGLGTPVISHTLIFEDAGQQGRWFEFLRWLRQTGAGNTLIGRLDEFLAKQKGVGWGS